MELNNQDVTVEVYYFLANTMNNENLAKYNAKGTWCIDLQACTDFHSLKVYTLPPIREHL